MKKFGFIVLVLAAAVYLAGCGKKQAALEELQEPLSMEALSSMGTETTAKATSDTQTAEVTATVAPAAEPNLETLPSGPYKPTAIEIQTALKNANYYTGVIDGKVGPMTKKAIEDFQTANGLKADGKVGLQTWAVLSASLNPAAAPKSKKKR